MDYHEAIKKAIVDRIRGDKLGGRAVRWWPSASDLMPPDREITPREVPAVRVEVASAGPSKRMTNEGGPIMRPMLATVHTWTQGPGNDKALYLWAVIESIFDPVDQDKRDYLDEYLDVRNIWSLKIQQSAIPTVEQSASPIVPATGIIAVSFWDEITQS